MLSGRRLLRSSEQPAVQAITGNLTAELAYRARIAHLLSTTLRKNHLNAQLIIYINGSATAGTQHGGTGMVSEGDSANITTLLTRQQRFDS